MAGKEKGGRSAGGLSSIKTAQKAKVHSKPRVAGSEYLELYMLFKEKERLEQYKSAVGKTNEQVETDLDEVQKEIERLEGKEIERLGETVPKKDSQKESKRGVEKRVPRKPMKTIALDY